MARKGIGGRDFQFFDTLALNNITYNEYTIRLLNIALARFKWENVPKGIDIRYLELMLITQGSVLVFMKIVWNSFWFRSCVYRPAQLVRSTV